MNFTFLQGGCGMGILDLFGKAVPDTLNAASNLYTTDKARIEAETKLEEVEQKPQLAQLNNNAIMASATNLFNSGWQPLVGWTAGFLVLIYYFPQILIITYVWGVQCVSTKVIVPFPMKPDDILNLVYLLFGFGVQSLAKKMITKK